MIIDILLIVVILIFAFVGLVRGFVASLFKFFNGTTSMVVATFLSKPLSKLFAAFKVNDLISKLLGALKVGTGIITEEKFNEILSASENSVVAGDVLSANVSGSGSFLLKTFFSNMFTSETIYTTYENLLSTFTYAFATIIVVFISYILSFILIKVTLNIINKIFTNEAGARRFGSFDRILGMIFGLLKACGFIILVVCAFNILGVFPVVGNAVENILAGTKITAWIYSLITRLFAGIVTNINFNDLIAGHLAG